VDWFCFGERVWAQRVQKGVAVSRDGCTVQGAMVYESEVWWTGFVLMSECGLNVYITE
jgi:hypothetical protein